MSTPETSARTALVVGASGIAGSAIVEQLNTPDRDVVALSRTPVPGSPARHVSADLRSAESLAAALAGERPTHVFFTARSRQATARAVLIQMEPESNRGLSADPCIPDACGAPSAEGVASQK